MVVPNLSRSRSDCSPTPPLRPRAAVTLAGPAAACRPAISRDGWPSASRSAERPGGGPN